MSDAPPTPPTDRSRSMGLVFALIAGCMVMAVILFLVVRSKLLTAYEEEVAPTNARAQLTFVANLITLHAEEHGSPPAALDDLVPEFLQGPPIDPWGRELLYERQDDGTWVLRTLGADGQEGGAGPDADLVAEPE